MAGDPEGRESRGRLFVVATPVGHLEDITLRALKTLRAVDLIACEDTRQTLKLLNRYKIRKPLLSYYQPREKLRVPKILEALRQGRDVALVSDAGTPGLSDPGFPLIRAALEAGIRIHPIPGPSALAAALSACGLPTHRVLFLGFAPPKKTALDKLLTSLADEPATLVFYLPARRANVFLSAVEETLGDRPVVLAREMTKIHEEFLRGRTRSLLRDLESSPLRGELTVLVEGHTRKSLDP